MNQNTFFIVNAIRDYCRRCKLSPNTFVTKEVIGNKGGNTAYRVRLGELDYLLFGKVDLNGTEVTVSALCALLQGSHLKRARSHSGRLLSLKGGSANLMEKVTPEGVMAEWLPH